ncbi:ribonuclease T2 family protein [Sphingomonas baiyangensis]|uniref:Ribonuclease T n=1 Tax=Sphingomonas baiyangensis TaxID=2572576 RepID=A0A4U1L1J1_9SPHN|nr:ribonuclease T [Sphingomonas baiyangensis]TKD50717.1 ribonuclease T [Sphingomonas baiyangensis]
MKPHALVVASVAAIMPSAALAQAYRCSVPATIERPRPDGPSAREPRRVVPTRGYTLALTWNPQYCRDNAARGGARFQCGAGNGFGFTLHGLWPDGDGVNRWPQYCRAAPLLSERVIRANLCTTPSVQLLQHEYAKHGTCMGLTPANYFRRASSLYGRLRYPDMQALSRRRGLTTAQFAQAFARANLGTTPAMMRITADRDGWLEEVWLCLDTRFAARVCSAHQRGRAGNLPLRIWRGGR